MKKLLFVALTLCFTTVIFAQTQKGYVKTKGRLDNDGNLIPGTPLSEVVVKVKDRNEVISDKRGDFSFPMSDQTYYLESIAKNGYVLIDPDVLSKQYNYSKNKLVIALETKDQQIEERMENFAKINAAQNEMIRKLRAEVKQLKEENKITEEEYGRRLQEIADMQMESQQLVEDMVERYSKIDYDQMSEFDRKISAYILNGELRKADSLINTKGDLGERAENLKKLNEANAKEREELTRRTKKLEKSEALALKELEDLANDYYHKFEIYKLQHKNDSAAYWLEERVKLDTTNVKWLIDAGDYLREYCFLYQKAFSYDKKALDIVEETIYNNVIIIDVYTSICCDYIVLEDYEKAYDYCNKILNMYNEDNANYYMISNIYDKLSVIKESQDKYDESLVYEKKAINVMLKNGQKNNLFMSKLYNNLGTTYFSKYEIDSALYCFNESLQIERDMLGVDTINKLVAKTYHSIGMIYGYKEIIDKAFYYDKIALRMYQIIYGDKNIYVAGIYNNMGLLYTDLEEYDKALDCFMLSLEMKMMFYDNYNTKLAINYNNIAHVYLILEYYEKAIEYVLKALDIDIKNGENTSNVARDYGNLAIIYHNMNDIENSLYYYEKSLIIRQSIYGDNNLIVADCLYNIGVLYDDDNQLIMALEYYQRALNIYLSKNGVDYPDTIKTKNKISKVEQKLKESQKK